MLRLLNLLYIRFLLPSFTDNEFTDLGQNCDISGDFSIMYLGNSSLNNSFSTVFLYKLNKINTMKGTSMIFTENFICNLSVRSDLSSLKDWSKLIFLAMFDFHKPRFS